MSKILIAPYAARLWSGKPSPKDYPYFPKLVELLNKDGYEVIQIGAKGEDRISGVSQFITNWPLRKICDLVNESATWVSVDSFLPHLCYCYRLKNGIVLFGQSDPRIWAHSQNINLLRGRDYLRQYQYQSWEAASERHDAFVYAENVIQSVYKLAPPPLTKKTTLGSYATSST